MCGKKDTEEKKRSHTVRNVSEVNRDKNEYLYFGSIINSIRSSKRKFSMKFETPQPMERAKKEQQPEEELVTSKQNTVNVHKFVGGNDEMDENIFAMIFFSTKSSAWNTNRRKGENQRILCVEQHSHW